MMRSTIVLILFSILLSFLSHASYYGNYIFPSFLLGGMAVLNLGVIIIFVVNKINIFNYK